jgi:hypothetical protein
MVRRARKQTNLRRMSLRFGSGALVPEHAAEMLRAAEYEGIDVLPAMPGVPIGMIVGRRPERLDPTSADESFHE